MRGSRVLHFTLGPVQGFVAQARRTRDLWAGSFLLSYLIGCAMRTVLQAGGRIVFPRVQEDGRVTDPLLKATQEHAAGYRVDSAPAIGTLPNRFKAEIPGDLDPGACSKAVQDKWEDIARAVWEKYVQGCESLGTDTRAIWDRQIGGFWEMAWCIGDDESLLDRRKNWRTFVPSEEPGDKCTVMGNLQEISGYSRSTGEGRQRQEAFWEALRAGLISQLDLRQDERLCAVALVKRLFPRVGREAIGWEIPQQYQQFPSTVFMATARWVAEQIEKRPDWAKEFAEKAMAVRRDIASESGTKIRCIEEAVRRHPEARGFGALDGNCFFKTALGNPRFWPEGTGPARSELTRILSSDHSAQPNPFYAVLVMDGDLMGALLRDFDGEVIGQALAEFGKKVREIVARGNGIVVYVGGEDVLALLPLEDALDVAVKLRRAYGDAFPDAPPKAQVSDRRTLKQRATLSGAIVYAHFHVPLKAVLQEGHRLLEGVAKEETGRDSLAVTVWKNAGPVLTWSSPWDVVTDGQPGRATILDELVYRFCDGKDDPRQFSNRFFYKIRERFSVLTDEDGIVLPGLDPVRLLAAEYLKSGETAVDRNEAEVRVGRLLRVCRRSWRDAQGNLHAAEGPLSEDGALLVRFLAMKGVEP